MLLQIRSHHFGDEDFVRSERSGRRVLAGDVLGERSLGACKIMFAASCALRSRSIEDEPHGAAIGATLAEVEARRFAMSGHGEFDNVELTIMESRAACVTKNLAQTTVN